MNHTEINTLIFDLGGVLLNLDYTLTIKAFEKLGVQDAEHLFSQKSQTLFFDDFETGTISADEFREELRALIPNPVSDAEIDSAWNTMLLDFPVDRFDFIKEIRKTHRIFLLSNTNEIHMAWFKESINEQFGKEVFFNLFEIAYLSNEMGMRKPNKEIFDFVIDQNHLDPSKTLFIDDSSQHLKGAEKSGLHTIWLAPGMETVHVLLPFLTQLNQ